MDTPYSPISCEYHDILESLAVRRAEAAVVYTDEAGAQRETRGRITDISAHAGVEHMTLSGGERIRLDRIVSVNGEALAGFAP